MNRRPSFQVSLIALAVSAIAPAQAQEGFERLPEPVMPTPASTEEEDQPIFGSARKISGEQDQRTKFSGDAELKRGTTLLRADEIEHFTVEDEIHAQGKVRFERGGDVLLTPELRLKLGSNLGTATKPEVYYGKVSGRGKAEKLELLGDEKQRLTQVEYTTCKPGDDSWLLRAKTIDVDQLASAGEARSATVIFKGLPILGTPYLSFALGNERRSGFLPPSLFLTNKTGIDVTAPYYFDIAANRDLTLETRLMTKRGLLLGGTFRYLELGYKGQVSAEWLPSDAESKLARGAFSAQHNWSRGAVSGGWNLQYASDDTYFSDLARTVTTVQSSFLPREAWLTYSQPLWNITGRVTTAQNLFDEKAGPRAVAYERVPQVALSYSKPGLAGFDIGLTADVTQFKYPSLREGRFLSAPIDVDKGVRAVVNPTISYPLVAPGYFVTPRLSIHAAHYNDIVGGQGGVESTAYAGPAEATRVVPIASLDSGLIFERAHAMFAPALKQTLEPRLYYLNVPYKDQSRLPNFDSALTDFSFAQLFSENVFAGQDRIADANHLTFALTTRYVRPDTGEERLRLAIAKRQYLTQQRVDLPGAVIPVGKSSDLLLAAAGSFGKAWTLDSAVQLNSDDNSVVRSSAGIRYNPEPRKLLNLAYRKTKGELEQYDASGQWRIGSRWYGVGRVNYSARDKRLAEALGALEYDANCWVARLGVSQFSTATKTSTTSFFFQLELVGLGGLGLGSNPIETIRRSVPGYRKLDAPEPWKYDPY